MQKAMIFNNIAIVCVKENAYRIFWYMSKDDGEWLSVRAQKVVNCVAQMGALNMTGSLGDGYTVQAQSAND